MIRVLDKNSVLLLNQYKVNEYNQTFRKNDASYDVFISSKKTSNKKEISFKAKGLVTPTLSEDIRSLVITTIFKFRHSRKNDYSPILNLAKIPSNKNNDNIVMTLLRCKEINLFNNIIKILSNTKRFDDIIDVLTQTNKKNLNCFFYILGEKQFDVLDNILSIFEKNREFKNINKVFKEILSLPADKELGAFFSTSNGKNRLTNIIKSLEKENDFENFYEMAEINRNKGVTLDYILFKNKAEKSIKMFLEMLKKGKNANKISYIISTPNSIDKKNLLMRLVKNNQINEMVGFIKILEETKDYEGIYKAVTTPNKENNDLISQLLENGYLGEFSEIKKVFKNSNNSEITEKWNNRIKPINETLNFLFSKYS